MILDVTSLSLTESSMDVRSGLSRVILDASIDMSEPCPIAIEMSD